MGWNLVLPVELKENEEALNAPAPRRLRFKELGSGMLSVSWKEPKGEFDSYRLIYSSASRSEVTDSSPQTHRGRQNSEPEQDNEISEAVRWDRSRVTMATQKKPQNSYSIPKPG
ncbi:hypothetical protein AOLI_G00186480 [Acnodon oligacanthus]